MKRSVINGLCVVAGLLILLFPFSVTKVDMGGTVTRYEAVLYSVEDTHEWRVNTDEGPVIENGIDVEILGFTVYRNHSQHKI